MKTLYKKSDLEWWGKVWEKQMIEGLNFDVSNSFTCWQKEENMLCWEKQEKRERGEWV